MLTGGTGVPGARHTGARAGLGPSLSPGRAVPPELVLAVPVFATRLVYLATLTLLPPLLVERGIAPGLLGVLVGAYGYAAVAMGLLAGTLADRFRPARLAALGSALVAVAIGLLLVTGQPLVIGAARVLHGIAMGLFRPALAALLLQRAPAERRATAVASNNVAYIAGASAGPLAAGLLADRLGLASGLAAGAAVAALAALYLLVLGGGHRPAEAARASVWAGLRRLPGLARERRLGAPMVLVLADMAVLHLWLVYLPLYLVGTHGLSLAAAGSLISVEALGYALAQPLWGRLLDRRRADASAPGDVADAGAAPWSDAGGASGGPDRFRPVPAVLIAVSLLAHGACIAALPLAGGAWPALAVLLVACGALNAGAYPGCVTMAAGRARDDERGRAMGLLASASDVGQIVGPAVASVLVLASGRIDAVFPAALVLAGVGVAGSRLMDRRRWPA